MLKPKDLNYNDQETLYFIKDGHADNISVTYSGLHLAYPYYKLINNISFEDMVAVNALAISQNIEHLNKYISLRNNPSNIENNKLSPHTETTCGIFVFQEQILSAIHYFTNWEFEKVDSMRKVLTKKMLNTALEKDFISCFENKEEGQNIFRLLQDNSSVVQKNWIEKQTKLFFFFAYCACHDRTSYMYYIEALEAYVDKLLDL